MRKKHAHKQFPLLRKIILLRCLFYVCLRAFSPYKRFGPWVENKKSGNLIWAARKNGGNSEQAFAPSFLPSPEAKEKAKIQKKVLDKGYISKPFSAWRIPHTSERNAQKWPRVITSILEWLLNDLLRLPIQWFAFYCIPWINFVEQELIYGLESTWYTEVTQASKNSWVQKSKFWFGSITELNRTHSMNWVWFKGGKFLKKLWCCVGGSIAK